MSGGLTDFDAAGNQLCDSDPYGASRSYVYDPNNQIVSLTMAGSSSPLETYIYDGSNGRIRKDNADGTWTEYGDLGGQPIAEKDQTGGWTDYIYAGGKKIAKMDWEDAPIHISGDNCSDCEGTASYVFMLARRLPIH